jgi:hypothetical protein
MNPWHVRAAEIARSLEVPEAELIEETKHAIILLAAQRIAQDEVTAWASQTKLDDLIRDQKGVSP